MRRASICLISVMAIVFLATAAKAADVSQGKCIQFDADKMLITIQEYDTNFSKDHPHGRPTDVKSVYNASKAEIGADPKAGDILRIAYEVKGTDRVAIKVMNVSRQDLMKK
jgi:hypothetical protein